MFKRFPLVLLSVFLLAASPPPSRNKYCAPLAFQDYVVGVGYQAVVRAAPRCLRPALVRKENRFSGARDKPVLVPVGQVAYFWLFTHRLTYTLDGKTWRAVEAQ